jgi:hypothetical protein
VLAVVPLRRLTALPGNGIKITVISRKNYWNSVYVKLVRNEAVQNCNMTAVIQYTLTDKELRSPICAYDYVTQFAKEHIIITVCILLSIVKSKLIGMNADSN